MTTAIQSESYRAEEKSAFSKNIIIILFLLFWSRLYRTYLSYFQYMPTECIIARIVISTVGTPW